MTLLHVVLGEFSSKTMAIQAAEKSAFRIARPIFIFNKIMKPSMVTQRISKYYCKISWHDSLNEQVGHT